MHEMSLLENVLQILEDAAQQQKFTRISSVWLEIGQLACVEQESLRFAFDVVMHGSVAHQARLEIIEVAGQGRCNKCGQTFLLPALYEACSACGSHDVIVIAGDALRVKEIEVQ